MWFAWENIFVFLEGVFPVQLKDKHISIFRENRMKIASSLISIFRYFTTLLSGSDSIRIPNLISSAIRHSFSLSLTKLNSILFTGGFTLAESLPHGFNIPSSPTFTPLHDVCSCQLFFGAAWDRSDEIWEMESFALFPFHVSEFDENTKNSSFPSCRSRGEGETFPFGSSRCCLMRRRFHRSDSFFCCFMHRRKKFLPTSTQAASSSAFISLICANWLKNFCICWCIIFRLCRRSRSTSLFCIITLNLLSKVANTYTHDDMQEGPDEEHGKNFLTTFDFSRLLTFSLSHSTNTVFSNLLLFHPFSICLETLPRDEDDVEDDYL